MSVPATQPGKIRVGVLLDSFHQPRWVASILQELDQAACVSVVLVVRNASVNETKQTARQRFQGLSSHFAYRVYKKLDEHFARRGEDPFELIDVSGLLTGVHKLQVSPRCTKYSDYFEDEDIKEVSRYRLDVGLRFGFRILRGEILNAAKHGIWSYHHGDNRQYRGGPPGFWEVMNGDVCMGTVLQVLSEDLDGGRVIYRSTSSVHPHSVHRSRAEAYWKASRFVRRALEALQRDGRIPTERAVEAPYSRRLYKTPGNLEMVRLLGGLACRAVKNHTRAAVSDYRWKLGFAFEPEIGRTPLYRFRVIEPPAGRFWADPHVVWDADSQSHLVFFEEYIERQRKGRIAALRMDGDGKYEHLGTVLEQDYHLSYPFVFRWDDMYYMIPETAQEKRLELYRSVSFPNRWEQHSVLFDDISAADATIAKVGKLHWLFMNIAAPGASKNDELHLFFSESPLGPWTPHVGNPVKSDVRSARPAGRLYQSQGRLYRPAQDCSVRYGYAISINRVDKLTADEYEEHEVGRIQPNWRGDLLGAHSINHAEGLTFIDMLCAGSKLTGLLARKSDPAFKAAPSRTAAHAHSSTI